MTTQPAPSDFWRQHLKVLAIRSSNLSSHRNYDELHLTDSISGLSLSAQTPQPVILKYNTLGRAKNYPRLSDQCKGRAERV